MISICVAVLSEAMWPDVSWFCCHAFFTMMLIPWNVGQSKPSFPKLFARYFFYSSEKNNKFTFFEVYISINWKLHITHSFLYIPLSQTPSKIWLLIFDLNDFEIKKNFSPVSSNPPSTGYVSKQDNLYPGVVNGIYTYYLNKKKMVFQEVFSFKYWGDHRFLISQIIFKGHLCFHINSPYCQPTAQCRQLLSYHLILLGLKRKT